MECHEVQSRLMDFLDNQLDKNSIEEIEKHLETCAICKAELAQMQVLVQTMEESPVEQPSKNLRENFNYMLESELNRLAAANNVIEQATNKPKIIRWPMIMSRVAAVVILVTAGIWIGTRLKTGAQENPATQIAELKSEVKEMKEVMMFNLLKNESASERIKAVNYVEDMPNPNQKVIAALLNILDHDKNVNVRLASLYSLARFSDNQKVRDSLVNSLTIQTEPIIQIVLINLLTEKKEAKAVKPIRDIMSNEKNLKEVRDIAQKSLKTL